MFSNKTSKSTSIKIVVLGRSGVGKTSIIDKWINGSMSTKTTPTISATHYVQFLKIGDQEAKIFICDASGQEQFDSLIPIYIRQSSIAIVVADITDTSSFDKIQSCLDKIYMENCTEIPKILAVKASGNTNLDK